MSGLGLADAVEDETPCYVGRDPCDAGFDLPVRAVDVDVGGDDGVGIVEEQGDIGVQRLLVSAQRQDIFRARLVQEFRGSALAVQRVERHGAPLQVEVADEVGYGGDFVGLLVDGDLSEDKFLPKREDGMMKRKWMTQEAQSTLFNPD